MWVNRLYGAAAGAGAFLAGLTPALAQEVVGAPRDWQLGFQPAVSPFMRRLDGFHDFLLIVTILIAIFLFGLMAYVIVRFRAGRNPVPSKTTHNTLLEVIWTVIPIIILVIIAVPSFRLLYLGDRAVDYEMTLKVIGHQWWWTYEYPDHGNFAMDAFMIEDDDIQEGQLRLLDTDTRVVVPVNTTIQLLITADDVIHSWAIPAFGVKLDAVPGRVNETWMRVDREGLYYGQCSELCGVNHGFMPIVIEAVSQARFDEWVVEAQQEFGSRDVPAADRRIAARTAQ
jgi:cytochrome c oxidase subunit 2